MEGETTFLTNDGIARPQRAILVENVSARSVPRGCRDDPQASDLGFFPPVEFYDFLGGHAPIREMSSHAEWCDEFGVLMSTSSMGSAQRDNLCVEGYRLRRVATVAMVWKGGLHGYWWKKAVR